ncbi:hypothetical protein E2562_024485 [Oryza meyeriana var. granulata]|uniref:Uncharacterized protein n=1 Tax=Oryza meyeriana var. granulata TaxID=110450 RepID=A0A6G1FBT9_9ORYZ|nr:hypothetical protein E2562_024485 [Oryza meyeriana var. granulata]
MKKYNEDEQEAHREDDVINIEELRDHATLQAANYQQALHQYHSRRIRERTLVPGYLVLRKVQSQVGRNKLSPKWRARTHWFPSLDLVP